MPRLTSSIDGDEPLPTRDGAAGRVRLPVALEREFRRQDAEERRRHALQGMALGLVCYLGLLGIDWLVVPDVAALDAAVRIAIGLPVGALALCVLSRPGLPSSVHQGTVALYGLTCAATIGFVMSRSAEPAGLAYFCAGLVVMSFTINLVGMNPPIAGALCVAITLTTSALSAGSRFGSTGVVVTHLVFGAMVTVVATFANWCLLNQRRRAFLMHRRAEEQLRRIAEQRDLLERMAAIDPLTELPNRRGFDDLLVRDLVAAAEGSPLAVAMVDVDCFKAFNDGYGHPSGDAALRAIAGALREACGPGGRVGRLGGEEFGVVVLGGAADDLPTLGERLREAVETLSIPHRWSGVAPCVTISVGLVGARIKDGRRDCADLFALADEALYDAKRSGRNRSTSFADEHDVNAVVVTA